MSCVISMPDNHFIGTPTITCTVSQLLDNRDFFALANVFDPNEARDCYPFYVRFVSELTAYYQKIGSPALNHNMDHCRIEIRNSLALDQKLFARATLNFRGSQRFLPVPLR
jgi:hypothetical protein